MTPLRLLVAEDSTDDAELLVAHLRRAGYELDWRRVYTAASLRLALGDATWDVVLADYSMPQFTALDALAIIKELGLDVPFIIVSGSIGEAAAVKAMKAGAHDFFLKDKLTRLASAIERERGEARVRHERRQAVQELRESQERLGQAVRARDEFLSIASHELKTPLTSLSFQVESARGLIDDPAKLKPKLDSISRQVTRLTGLINNLLDVTRITSGRVVLSPEALDLREIVDSVVAEYQDAIRRSGSAVTVDGGGPVRGQWDRLGIESAISNIVFNAIKYGEGKPIEIEVDGDSEAALVIVTDHGVGIQRTEQERIFHRFERAVPETHYGGLGLGLWVAREIVEAHGGTIAVASKPGCGSIFTIRLPHGHKDATA